MSDADVAYQLWIEMSRRGWISLELLSPDEYRIAHEMVARGLVQARDGHMCQNPNTQLHQWEGLA